MIVLDWLGDTQKLCHGTLPFLLLSCVYFVVNVDSGTYIKNLCICFTSTIVSTRVSIHLKMEYPMMSSKLNRCTNNN